MHPSPSPAPRLSMFRYQVSGKAPKLISPDNNTLYKCHIPLEQAFYDCMEGLHVSRPEYCLRKFLPKYSGLVCLEDKPEI